MDFLKIFIIVVTLFNGGISENWQNGNVICPHQCVCQYSHFMDLSIARWINFVQSNRNDKIDKESTDDLVNDNEALFDNDDTYLTNPLIKQATCILQIETNPKDLFNHLPHDVQSLVILYTGGHGKNLTVPTSELKPLNQLTTLEIRGPIDRTFKLLIDEPLSFLQNANFESIQLLSSENFKRPKNPIHPSESFDYVPYSEKIAYNISNYDDNNNSILLESEDEIEILPYDIYIMELKKSRMATFYGWEHLEVLRINNCKLDELHWEMFDGLGHLQHLSLEKNDIKTIPAFALYGAMHIKTLSLAKNQISDLNYRALAGLLELETLDLSTNNLTRLSELTFPPFPKLEFIDFRQNPIHYIFPSTFGIMNNTRTILFGSNEMDLELSGNQPFASLELLKNLFINNLTITILEQNIFRGLKSLEMLNLNGEINRIEFDAFADMQELRELNLSNCKIREISMDSFIGCKNLEIIDLSYNQLKYIPPGLFDDQHQLTEIYLQKNHLKYLPTSFFNGVALKLIRLIDNPWKCTCKMAGIWKPKLTNQFRSQKQERCITDFHSGKVISCRKIDNYKFDNKLSPRCDNIKGRSVYYALRKDLQCNFRKEYTKLKRINGNVVNNDDRRGPKYRNLSERKERHRQKLENRNEQDEQLHINNRNKWQQRRLEKIDKTKQHINSLDYLAKTRNDDDNIENEEHILQLGEIHEHNSFNYI